jgi:hypothetical protein
MEAKNVLKKGKHGRIVSMEERVEDCTDISLDSTGPHGMS